MGLNMTCKGADFSANPLGYILPVSRGAEYFNFFGDSTDRTPRNLVPGKAPGVVVGFPSAATGYVSLRNASTYIRTGLLDQVSATLLVVARFPNLQANAFGFAVSNFNGAAAAAGSSILVHGTSRKLELYSSRGAAGSEATVETPLDSDIATWGFYAARVGQNYQRIDDKTRSLTNVGSITQPRTTANGIAYMIGSSNGGGNGLVDVAFAAIHSAELTDAEIDLIYRRVRAYEALKGIAI